MTAYNYEGRLETVKEAMRRNNVSAMLLCPSSDLKYLSGYPFPIDDKLLLMAIFTEAEPFIIASHLHDIDLERLPIKRVLYYQYGKTAIDFMTDELKERADIPQTIAIEDQMPANFVLEIQKSMPNTKFVSANSLIAGFRSVKDRYEIEATQTACRRAEEALRRCMALGDYWLGKTEEELEARMIFEMGSMGLKNNAVSVCYGANAAIAHHHPDSTVIRAGAALLIDFGASYDFYNTDMTRMFYFGVPDEEYCRIYYVVLEALEAAIQMCKIGNTLQQVDKAAREHISSCGYGAYYIHRTSHGVGIDCHDYPQIPIDGETMIENGMIFSVEPGIYLPKRLGIRIEDQIVMIDGEARLLHTFDRNLISIS